MKKSIGVFSAEYIKSQLIDFYISESSNNLVIGNEVMYGTKRKLVDLLVLNNNKLTAIEIKTDSDDLRKLKEQITEYKKLFDYVIVCTTNTHLIKIRQSTTQDIGIYIFKEQNIEIIRKPQQQRQLDKSEMLFTINAQYLKQNSNSKIRKYDSDAIRSYYAKRGMHKIRQIFHDYLYSKIESKYDLFLQYRGKFTHIDDIPLLSSYLYVY